MIHSSYCGVEGEAERAKTSAELSDEVEPRALTEAL